MSTADDRALEVACFRYRLIAEALLVDRKPSEGTDHGSVSEAIAEAAASVHVDPQGRRHRVSERTLWRWLARYRKGKLEALKPRARADRGALRALSAALLARAKALREAVPSRPTKTIIDMLVRRGHAKRGEIATSTLDRHLERAGLSRRRLRTLGRKVFRKIETERPFEFVVVDFHHGPYVRVAHDETLHRALLCAFIDHFSRFVPEARYYLHEDFAALRFGFRRLLVAYGKPEMFFVDRGAAFQANRFHAACDALDIKLVHARPYAAEGRGLVERFNRTTKEQFESEARAREEPPTLDELNGFFEAWLAERYHQDIHSETNEAPFERFRRSAALRPAPALELVDELLRLKERRTVHRKWSTVEVGGRRYTVDAALRGRRVDVLYDPFDPAYVLIGWDGRTLERALPQQPGVLPPERPARVTAAGAEADYLTLLRESFEARAQSELAALRLRPAPRADEIDLAALVVLLERCRARALSATEHAEAGAFYRKMRPLERVPVESALESSRRRLGSALHLRVYLDALERALVRARIRGGKKP